MSHKERIFILRDTLNSSNTSGRRIHLPLPFTTPSFSRQALRQLIPSQATSKPLGLTVPNTPGY